MVELIKNGCYLLNGTDLVECNQDGEAVLKSKYNVTPDSEKDRKAQWHTGFWRSIIHPVIWTS